MRLTTKTEHHERAIREERHRRWRDASERRAARKSLATAFLMKNKEQRLRAAGSRNGIISSSFEFRTRHVEYKGEGKRGGEAERERGKEKRKKQKGRN